MTGGRAHIEPKGVAEQGSWTKGQGGKAKKKVTAPILMAEVVVRNFGFALDGSPGVQGVFELL